MRVKCTAVIILGPSQVSVILQNSEMAAFHSYVSMEIQQDGVPDQAKCPHYCDVCFSGVSATVRGSTINRRLSGKNQEYQHQQMMPNWRTKRIHTIANVFGML